MDERQDSWSVTDDADTKLLCVGDEGIEEKTGSCRVTWVGSSSEEIEERDLRDGEINSWDRILEPRRDTEGVGGRGVFDTVAVTVSE